MKLRGFDIIADPNVRQGHWGIYMPEQTIDMVEVTEHVAVLVRKPTVKIWLPDEPPEDSCIGVKERKIYVAGGNQAGKRTATAMYYGDWHQGDE